MGNFQCPYCGQNYALVPQLAGQAVQCGRCGKVFQMPAMPQAQVGPKPQQGPIVPSAPAGPANLGMGPFGTTPASIPLPSQPTPGLPNPLAGQFGPAPGPLPGSLGPMPAQTPAASLPASGGKFRRRGMSDSDRVLLVIGGLLSGAAMVALLILFPLLGINSTGAVILVMLVGLGGSGLLLTAQRRKMGVAIGVSGGTLLLLIVGAVLSVRSSSSPPVPKGVAERTGSGTPSPNTGQPPPTAPVAGTSGVQPVPPVAFPGPTPPPGITVPSTNPPVASSVNVASGAPMIFGPLPSQEPQNPGGGMSFGGAPEGAKTQMIGGSENGGGFDDRFTGPPLTAVAYRLGNFAGEPGFLEIRPYYAGSRMTDCEILAARDGYGVGAISVDSGGRCIRALQVVFMRIRPDERLDPADSYTSPWVGTARGPVQTATGYGGRILGFYGEKSAVVTRIGLVFYPGEKGQAVIASNPKPVQPGMSQPGQIGSPPPITPAMPGATASAGSPPNTTGEATSSKVSDLPPAVTAVLNSVVLVEHPLGSGSGFAVAKDVVATNAHVVEGAFAEDIKVKFGKENEKPRRITRVLHYDRARDLCLLQGAMDLKPIPVRDDYVMQSGDEVILIGSPSVSGGMLLINATNRGKMRRLMRIDGQDVYHIDATVNPGWSGGPILDTEGRLIAVVAMKALDQSVLRIRGAMQRLDDNFRGSAGAKAQGGITYGIPGSALAKVLSSETFKDEAHQAQVHSLYTAQTVVQRLSFLAAVAMVRVQANVPLQVRYEAQAMEKGGPVGRYGRGPAVKVEYIQLMPEELAKEIGMALASRRVQEMEEQFRKRLDERIEDVNQSEHIAVEVKRDLKALIKTLKDVAKFNDKPATTYAAYSVKVKGFTRDVKEILRRLESAVGVEDKESGEEE